MDLIIGTLGINKDIYEGGVGHVTFTKLPLASTCGDCVVVISLND